MRDGGKIVPFPMPKAQALDWVRQSMLSCLDGHFEHNRDLDRKWLEDVHRALDPGAPADRRAREVEAGIGPIPADDPRCETIRGRLEALLAQATLPAALLGGVEELFSIADDFSEFHEKFTIYLNVAVTWFARAELDQLDPPESFAAAERARMDALARAAEPIFGVQAAEGLRRAVRIQDIAASHLEPARPGRKRQPGTGLLLELVPLFDRSPRQRRERILSRVVRALGLETLSPSAVRERVRNARRTRQ